MGKVAEAFFDDEKVYACAGCGAHLALCDEIINNSFHGRHGRAFLFERAINVRTGPPEDRMLLTGLHTVKDVYCNVCHKELGWTYERAYEEKERYKIGKFVIERKMMVRTW